MFKFEHNFENLKQVLLLNKKIKAIDGSLMSEVYSKDLLCVRLFLTSMVNAFTQSHKNCRLRRRHLRREKVSIFKLCLKKTTKFQSVTNFEILRVKIEVSTS